MKNEKKKGFTLIEILGVIVILGIIILISVPLVRLYIESSKKKSFFTSVSNIANSIKLENVLEEKDYCMYDYSKDKNNQTDNINSMYVLVHKENDKLVYSVYASMVENEIGIDVYDFSTLSINDMDSWVKEQDSENSFTWYAASLMTLFEESNSNEFSNFKMCELD